MMFKQIFILVLFLLSLISYNVNADDVDNAVILEKIESLSKRVDDKFVSVEKQIDLLRQDLDRRFQAVDNRFANQQVFNYFILGGVLTILTLISALIIMGAFPKSRTF